MSASQAAAFSSTLVHAGVPANLASSLSNSAMHATSNSTFTEQSGVSVGRVYGRVEERMNIPLGQMILNGQISAQQAERKLTNDVQQIEAYNAPIRDLNRKARRTLADTVGTDLGDDPEAWDRWTTDLFGRLTPVSSLTQEVPTVTEEVTPGYLPQAIPTVATEVTNVVFVRRMSCFAAGTPVRTIDGSRPIEDIRPGDLVLTQDTTTGQVTFNPVLSIFHNPPKETLKISLEGADEAIVPTEIHRFWKAGQGWVMARDLKAGDVLRTVGGSVTVRSVEPDKTQPVYNLRVADAADYFVGELGILSHDNSLPTPVDKPFDRAAPELASAGRK
jgi:hypothetical protein